MGKVFGQARTRPAGTWVQTTGAESVAGIGFRRKDCSAFASAVAKADKKGLPYGVSLRPDPDNTHDRHAIEVWGWCDLKGWFSTKRRNWMIGFLPRETAEEMHEDILSKEHEIGAELYRIYRGDNGFLDIKVIVLGPKGFGQKKRLSSRRTPSASH